MAASPRRDNVARRKLIHPRELVGVSKPPAPRAESRAGHAGGDTRWSVVVETKEGDHLLTKDGDTTNPQSLAWPDHKHASATPSPIRAPRASRQCHSFMTPVLPPFLSDTFFLYAEKAFEALAWWRKQRRVREANQDR